MCCQGYSVGNGGRQAADSIILCLQIVGALIKKMFMGAHMSGFCLEEVTTTSASPQLEALN